MSSLYSGWVTRSSSLAALIVLLYDNVLEFGDEVQLVWAFPWSFGSILYIANRWSAVVALTINTLTLFRGFSDISCSLLIQYRLWGRWLTFMVAEGFLLARIHALYNRNKPLLIALAVLYLVEFVTIIAFLYGQSQNTLTNPQSPSVSNCFYLSNPKVVSGLETWLPLLLYMGILCGFMIYKAWRTYKEDKPGRLLGVILRDGLFYYATLFAVVFINYLFYLFIPVTNPQWVLPWLSAIPALIANRLFLNTRREYYRRRFNLSSVHITDALVTRPL